MAARESLNAADAESPLAVDDLWRLAVSSYLVGDEGAFVDTLERGHRLAREVGDDAVAGGYLLLPKALERFGAGDPEGAHDLGRDAAIIAERSGERDLLALALLVQGRGRVGHFTGIGCSLAA
ncbi:MAG: hypothetical protein PVJ04_13415 [Gemmatimonadota bacterium]